jgi:hypothetical protein
MSENTHELLIFLIEKAECKPGWIFDSEGQGGDMRMTITVAGKDSYTGRPLSVRHFFPVPMATYNEKSWRRWIFECCRKVEDHELGEWFKIDGARPFAPLHGPGEDPYTVHEFRSELDARTLQDGSIGEKV